MSDDLDTAAFLQNIQKLGQERDQQDNERMRKLEEDIERDRKERMARRAERERSLSPDKPITPQSHRSTAGTPREIREKAANTPAPIMEPLQNSPAPETLDGSNESPAHTLEDLEPKKPTPNTTALRRSGTILGWQQRPPPGTRRPLSMAAASPARGSPRDTPEPGSPTETMSRDQIAQSLGAKDPAYFRQTADRGIGSAAYRKNQEEQMSQVASVSGRRPLPGMSRESTAESETTSPPPESMRSSSPSRESSIRGSAASSNRFSATTSVSNDGVDATSKTKSPLPVLNSQVFQPPFERRPSVDPEAPMVNRHSLAMSPTQGRISPERGDRPSSPTKGKGGFVQSAFLKRSDSINKRWSAQNAPGLSRQSSTASNISLGEGPLRVFDPRPSSLSRDPSTEPSSRPGSSSSNLTITRDAEAGAQSEFVRPALPFHARARSTTSASGDRAQDESGPPSSPKKWSPTKASWLESALNRPESPQLKGPTKAQPEWMAEISRRKQQRGSVDLGTASPLSPPAEITEMKRPLKKDLGQPPSFARQSSQPDKHEVKEAVFVTATKPVLPAKLVQPTKEDSQSSTKSVQTSKLPNTASEAPSAKLVQPTKEDSQSSVNSVQIYKLPNTAREAPSASTNPILPSKVVDAGKETDSRESAASPVANATTAQPSSTAARFSKGSSVPSQSPKPKPNTPPKKDFRAALRSCQTPSDAPKKEVPKQDEGAEFQKVFGKLKKAETKNYVPPDELKSNILRGKAGLNTTGGPKPSERKDEFRQSLQSQKAAMLAKALETGSAAHKRTDSSSSQQAPPEAIARRNTLGRAGSVSSVSSPPPRSTEESTPEALARLKSIREAAKPAAAAKPSAAEKVSTAEKPPAAEKPSQAEPTFPSREPAMSNSLTARLNPNLAGLLARGPSPLSSGPASSRGDLPSSSGSVPSAGEEKQGPGPELTHMTKGRAKGPRRRAPGAKQSGGQEDPTESKSSARGEPAASKPAVAAHASVPIVKTENILSSGRPAKVQANGLPESVGSSTPVKDASKGKPVTPVKSLDLGKKTERLPSPELPRKPSLMDLEKKGVRLDDSSAKPAGPQKVDSPKPKSPASQTGNFRTSRPLPSFKSEKKDDPQAASEEKPTAPQTSTWRVSRPLPSLKSDKKDEPQPASEEKPTAQQTSTGRVSRPLPTPQAENKEEPRLISEERSSTPARIQDRTAESPREVPAFSVKNVASLWSKQPSPTTTRTKSPIKLPTRADEQAAMENAGLAQSPESAKSKSPEPVPKPKPVGLGLGGLASGFLGSRGGFRESSPPKASQSFPASPPASGGRPQSMPFTTTSKPSKPDTFYAQFFDEPPIIPDELPKEVQTLNILTSSPIDLGPSSKIRTLRKQMQELSGDGKLTTRSAQEEHILFQDSMYICVHEFGDSTGAKHVEVYLWSGNGVPDPTVDDVQIFARDIAKQSHGKLVSFKQGKETPNFFEALGGIVITRRGSRPGTKPYMLCGRRHLGHLAFDEVDLSLKSLCSGFPYLVVSPTGKVFLWVGCGCSNEERSGARLMGMDLGETGELTELEEKSETPEFLSIFPSSEGTTIPRSADHWRFKPAAVKYRPRLFKFEQRTVASSGWGSQLQVSSLFSPASGLFRRPSWSSMSSHPSSPEPQPQQHRPTEFPWPQNLTPSTPKSPPTAASNVKVSITEIMPFCQRDLEAEYIYVLDAFFEMYIILGPLSRSQPAAFSTALLFAQEYSVLAVNEDDRPMVPVATVVLEGTPRDMKANFRSWDDKLIPAAALMTGKLGRGKSLRIVGLDRAVKEVKGQI